MARAKLVVPALVAREGEPDLAVAGLEVRVPGLQLAFYLAVAGLYVENRGVDPVEDDRSVARLHVEPLGCDVLHQYLAIRGMEIQITALDLCKVDRPVAGLQVQRRLDSLWEGGVHADAVRDPVGWVVEAEAHLFEALDLCL